MNRILSFLLGSLLLATPAARGQFNYTVTNSAVTITGYTGTSGNVTIPDTTNSLPVTSIADNAFLFSTITNVTFGTNLTSIGASAFGASALDSVFIPTNVTNIGLQAFNECLNLTAITVASQNPAYSSLNGVLFDKNQSTLLEYPNGVAGSYTVPGSVTVIATCAFQYSYYLAGVTLPNSVTSIQDNAFEFCTNLTDVVMPDSVSFLGTAVFWRCYSLTNVTLSSGLATIGYEEFSYSGLTSVTVPASVTQIDDYAFAYCSALSGVYFQGNAPGGDSTVFASDYNVAVIHYLPGATGWGATYAGIPTTDGLAPATYTISVSASPATGGTVSGGGTFSPGTLVTLSAAPYNGYAFDSWTQDGAVMSSLPTFSFNVDTNLTLVANFLPISSSLSTYWPLNDGDQKTFVYSGTESLDMSVSDLGGGQFEISESTASLDESLVVQEDQDSSSLVSVGAGRTTVSVDPVVLLLDGATLQNGGTVETATTVTQPGISYPAIFTVTVGKTGTVKVPAGTFDNCRSITASETAKVPGHGTIHAKALTAVLAPNVGIIKTQVKAGVWAELISGTVGGVDVTAYASAPATSSKAPRIETQPMSEVIMAGSEAAFSVMVANSASALSYQWKHNGKDLFDNGNVYGSATPNLTIYSAESSDAGTYSVVVSDATGSVTSKAAKLTLKTAPYIITEPVDETVEVGHTAVFAVKAGGTAPLRYAWVKDGSQLFNGDGVSGATTARLIIHANADSAGEYSVSVFNDVGEADSDAVELTVVGAQ